MTPSRNTTKKVKCNAHVLLSSNAKTCTQAMFSVWKLFLAFFLVCFFVFCLKFDQSLLQMTKKKPFFLLIPSSAYQYIKRVFLNHLLCNDCRTMTITISSHFKNDQRIYLSESSCIYVVSKLFFFVFLMQTFVITNSDNYIHNLLYM